ncbi:hypothetical protein RDWZM_000335 [Blomia tropicalis]|uniref:NADH dehydrogenase [ubiquinone] 1 alpha subcomplex subunit 12 n=1 Tax=Blomia tropicalis TaxID=40697 RepID=A0A9Q0M9N8_BLOTA|nr:hypothetical protein RDWZM_000335 [Blomia tropicalis]
MAFYKMQHPLINQYSMFHSEPSNYSAMFPTTTTVVHNNQQIHDKSWLIASLPTTVSPINSYQPQKQWYSSQPYFSNVNKISVGSLERRVDYHLQRIMKVNRLINFKNSIEGLAIENRINESLIEIIASSNNLIHRRQMMINSTSELLKELNQLFESGAYDHAFHLLVSSFNKLKTISSNLGQFIWALNSNKEHIKYMSLKELFAIDKAIRFLQVIKANGGWRNSFKTLYRTDNLKLGTLVGTDKFGNKYFENNEYMHGANRWVIYADKVYLDYDGSMIDAEWHGWMHYMTDIPPTKANYPKHRWMIPHIDNVSGTPEQYVPYSTTPAKIHSWKPNVQSPK